MLKLKHKGQEIGFSFMHINPLPAGVGVSIGIAGMTDCTLIINETESHGQAFCSVSDRFDKETGRKVSLARALEASGVDKDTRTEVWNRYFLREMTNTEYIDGPILVGEAPQEIK